MESSQYYEHIQNKYHNEKTQKQLLGTIATIITSSFRIIDYDPNNEDILRAGADGNFIPHAGELHMKPIVIEPDIIIEEVLLYTLIQYLAL